MLEGLRSLIAVEKLGTVSEAAVQLRLTQSAVSKRLQALEREIGQRLVERDGRRLRLTRSGFDLLAKARPLLAEIENLKVISGAPEEREFSIGVSDSIAASWGPAVLRQTLAAVPELKVRVHVHRSTLIIENIKLGRYDLGLLTCKETEGGLVSVPLTSEEMVLIGVRRQKTRAREPAIASVPSPTPILTIETASATWREVGPVAIKHPRFQGRKFEFVESFTAAAQMAREGFGQALVPKGVANSLGFKASEITSLSPKIYRHVQFVTRKTLLELELVQKFVKSLAHFSVNGASL